HCALRESLQGYRDVLGEESISVAGEAPDWQRGCRLAIIPGIGAMDERIRAARLDLLAPGATVLLESGAGFLDPAEFEAHQKVLQRLFDVRSAKPVDVWTESVTIPYVQYEWPCEAMVRDFSRVIPLTAKDAEVIGRIGELPVALKRRVGN